MRLNIIGFINSYPVLPVSVKYFDNRLKKSLKIFH